MERALNAGSEVAIELEDREVFKTSVRKTASDRFPGFLSFYTGS